MISPQDQQNGLPAPLPSPNWRLGLERRGRRQMTIHVPLDGSTEAIAAMPMAREVARLTGAAVHIVHVSASPVRPEELPSLLQLPPDEMLGTSLDSRTGNPAEAIALAAAEHNSLAIVMTTRGAGAAPEFLGPVASEVVKLASCPILFVRPGARISVPIRHILLPLDGTPSAAAAIAPAMDLAHRAGASLEVLYVAWEKASPPSEPGSMTAPRYVDQPQHEWPAWAAEFLDRFTQSVVQLPYTVPTRLSLSRGQPGSEILQFARERDIDIIVLERRWELVTTEANLITAVLRTAPCPVLLLHKEVKPYVFDREHEAFQQT